MNLKLIVKMTNGDHLDNTVSQFDSIPAAQAWVEAALRDDLTIVVNSPDGFAVVKTDCVVSVTVTGV